MTGARDVEHRSQIMQITDTQEMEIAPRDKRVEFGLSALPRGSKIGNDNRSFRLAPRSRTSHFPSDRLVARGDRLIGKNYRLISRRRIGEGDRSRFSKLVFQVGSANTNTMTVIKFESHLRVATSGFVRDVSAVQVIGRRISRF